MTFLMSDSRIRGQLDMLSWLIDEAPEEERTTRRLAQRVLGLNFAAIHTSSFVRLSYYPPSRPITTQTLLLTDIHNCAIRTC